jgi:CPA2 family monovalent cation:H+ antiporter-2
MADVGELMFQLGILMLIAFLGAAVASRARLSAIIGYIVAGILIGPFIAIDAFGFSYRGLIQDTAFIDEVASIGLILLLFFVGLGFSITKLKRVKEAAAILAVMNLGVNMFGGFVIGTYFGWPLIDTIFLAGVISMSSSAVTAKALIDLKRLSNKETEFLLGMVILESFLAMFLLTMVNGLVVTESTPTSVPMLFLGVGLFIGFFAFLAAVVIPRVAPLFEQIKSDELFILFALGLVFLSAALAEALFIPAIIGAFFIGMAFADTRLVPRIQDKMESLRDVFVALFFIAFGMMIDPAMVPRVFEIVLLAGAIIIINDLFLTSSLAYFIGFGSRAATSIGAALVGRNEEAILYASVGTRAIQSNPNVGNEFGGTLLNPFAGILCIGMSGLAPVIMRHSARVADGLGRMLPASVKFGGDLMRHTLRTFTMPAYLPLYKRNRFLLAALLLYAAFTIVLVVSWSWYHLVLALLVPGVVYVMWAAVHRAFTEPVKHTNYGLATSMGSRTSIEAFVVKVVVGALAAVLVVAAAWQYTWQATLFVALGYFVYVVTNMKAIHDRLALGKVRSAPPVKVDRRMRALQREWRQKSRLYNGRQ